MMASDRRFCSVGKVLMREEGWKIGQQITLRDPENEKLKLTLIPMLELPTLLTARTLAFDRRVLDDAVKNTFGSDISDRASFLSVKVDRAENMDQVIAEIDENFHNSDAETETTEESDALASVVTGIGDIQDHHVQPLHRRAGDGVAHRRQLDGDDGARSHNRGRGDARARLRAHPRRRAAAGRGRADRPRRAIVGAGAALWASTEGSRSAR